MTRFDEIAERLSTRAAGVSAVRRLRAHPDYDEIVSMGADALPLLLARLEQAGSRPLWMSLLSDITGEAALLGEETIDAAAGAWRDWGQENGYLAA